MKRDPPSKKKKRPKHETVCMDMGMTIVTNLSSFYFGFGKNSISVLICVPV